MHQTRPGDTLLWGIFFLLLVDLAGMAQTPGMEKESIYTDAHRNTKKSGAWNSLTFSWRPFGFTHLTKNSAGDAGKVIAM